MTNATLPTAIMIAQDGDAIEYTPNADVSAGSVVVQGNLAGIAVRPITANILGSLVIGGVFDIAKYTGEVHAVGDTIHWDVADAKASKTSAYYGSGPILGKCVKAAAAGDAYTRIKLLPSMNA